MPSQVIKTKPPPQILPKPASGASPHTSSVTSVSTAKVSSQPTLAQTQTLAQPQAQALLLNQMLPNGAVLVQQQTSSGVQFILKSPPHHQHKTGLVLANGGLHQPQHVIVQGRTHQAHQVLRLVPGQMQLQQIQTSSGPTLIAVPANTQPAQRSTPSPQTHSQPTAIAIAHKKLKKKKKREDEQPPPQTHHRLDLANLIKISGIEDEDVISTTPASSASNIPSQVISSPVVKTTSPQPQPMPKPMQVHQTAPSHHHISAKHFNPSQLLAQLQSPAQAAGVTPSIAAAAQSQLAQLIADHGGQILQTNTSLSNNTAKETAFMQSLQTAVLQIQGASADGMVLRGIQNPGGSVVVNTAGTATSNIRRAPVVMGPASQQNGVRLVADLNGTLQQASSSLTEHNRLIVSSLAPAVLEQNRVQIVTGVPTSSALSLEQQNRLIVSHGTPNAMLTQQGRVLVSAGSLEQHQNRVQIVTSNSSAVSLTEQNRVIVSNVPNHVSLDQQNRLHFMSAGLQNSLMGEQNRVIVSGVQGNMSLSEQNRVQIVAGTQSSGMAVEQNRVIMSGVQSSLTEQQNRLQIVSGVPNSGNTLSLSEQNRVHIVSNMPNSNILSEKQNLVQIVNSNISLSEEQNRVQIVTSVGNQIPEQSRLHFVNSIPSSNSISMSEQNRVQLVTNVPVSNSFTLSDNVQLVTSLPNSVAEQNRIHFSSMSHSNSLNVPNHHNQQVHMVTSMPNITDSKVQVVTSLPSHTPVFSTAEQPQQSNKVHFAFKNHTNAPLEQKRSIITNYHSDHSNVQHSNVQVVSALVNSDKDKFIPQHHQQPQQQFVKPELRVISGCVSGKEKELRIEERDDGSKVMAAAALDQNIALCSGGVSTVGSLSDGTQSRVQYVASSQDQDSRVHVVGANNHHTSVISQGNQVRTSVVYSHDVSPKMAKSPGSGSSSFTSPINSPPPGAAPPPSPAAPTTFNNRPNLTVVTGPPRPVEQKQDLNSMVAVSTSSKTAQTSTAQTNTPRRTYDNSFLDSIAQAHPSLVINKSSPPQASKIIKAKKPVKKAALVKPMMAEDRSTVVDKDDPPNLVPINNNDIGAPPPPPSQVVSRVQTIQLTPQKQQQLKAIQAQVDALTANKFRSPAEQATLQRLVAEQRKILLGGKVVPTVPGQHAHGVAFVSSNVGMPSSTAPPQVRHTNHSTSQAPPQMQSRGVVTSSVEQQVQTPISMAPAVPQHVQQQQQHPTTIMSMKQQQHPHTASVQHVHPPPSHSAPQPTPPPQPQPQTTHAHKATSPIPTQHQVSTQTPQLPPPPPPPIFTRAKRAQLIEQQFQADRQGALAPDTHTPFTCKADAVKRLIRYHTLNEPVLSEKDLSKADEIFEQTARTLLDRKAHMYNKFAFLLLKESTRMEKTSELVLLNRLTKDEESSRNEQLVQAAQAAQQAAAAAQNPSSAAASTSTSDLPSGVKRERDDLDALAGPSDSSKKHCPDDEEINAQVQSAIDSILNLQRKPPP
uniref:GLTSCR protein conserved domain-containing protein n=3 Tax=Lygus hesperus TaxID=30085 RepID=A0A0A9XCI3_LYGHE